jgi:hypothetical protein
MVGVIDLFNIFIVLAALFWPLFCVLGGCLFYTIFTRTYFIFGL